MLHFYTPWKKSENWRFSVFRGCKIRTLVENGLTMLFLRVIMAFIKGPLMIRVLHKKWRNHQWKTSFFVQCVYLLSSFSFLAVSHSISFNFKNSHLVFVFATKYNANLPIYSRFTLYFPQQNVCLQHTKM